LASEETYVIIAINATPGRVFLERVSLPSLWVNTVALLVQIPTAVLIFINSVTYFQFQFPLFVGFYSVVEKAPPHQLERLEICELPPAGFGVQPRPPKGFPLFSALMIASPDTIILLIVNK